MMQYLLSLISLLVNSKLLLCFIIYLLKPQTAKWSHYVSLLLILNQSPVSATYCDDGKTFYFSNKDFLEIPTWITKFIVSADGIYVKQNEGEIYKV